MLTHTEFVSKLQTIHENNSKFIIDSKQEDNVTIIKKKIKDTLAEFKKNSLISQKIHRKNNSIWLNHTQIGQLVKQAFCKCSNASTLTGAQISISKTWPRIDCFIWSWIEMFRWKHRIDIVHEHQNQNYGIAEYTIMVNKWSERCKFKLTFWK